jgi:hypothetical protein
MNNTNDAIPAPVNRLVGRLSVRPCTLEQANTHIAALHRHHKRVQGHRFSLCCVDDAGNLHGVATVGRPVSASTEAYSVAEVTRLCTDGTKNACSILYAAVARACEAMGYDKVQTFILPQENGASLKASGWRMEGMSSGNSWTTSKRTRNADQDGVVKQRWSRVFRLPPNSVLDGQKSNDQQ